MVVQPCRIARCATGSFRSIQPFFFSHVLSFSFSHAHAHWSMLETRFLHWFVKPRYCSSAQGVIAELPRCYRSALLIIHPHELELEKMSRSIHFSLPRCGLNETLAVVVVACPTRYEILEIFSPRFDEVFCIIIF